MESSSSMAAPGQLETFPHRAGSPSQIQTVSRWLFRSRISATQFAIDMPFLPRFPCRHYYQTLCRCDTGRQHFSYGDSRPDLHRGFAGVASDTPFDRAVLTFSDVGDAFAVDNVTFNANKASDEGQTLILLSAGVSSSLFFAWPSQGVLILL